MEWATYLLWLQLATGAYWSLLELTAILFLLLILSVTDCVLDGERFEWCTENYMGEK